MDEVIDLEKLDALRHAAQRGVFEPIERQLTTFNIFDVLSVKDYEIRHSNMLAWLLRPNESHGLKTMFLKGVLEQIVRANPARRDEYEKLRSLKSEALLECDVERENEDRDLELTFHGARTVLVIENKWNSSENEGEGEDGGQLQKYYKAISSKPNFKGWAKYFIFLTPDKIEPSEKNRKVCGVLGYDAILAVLNSQGVLERLSSPETEAQRMFINHYRSVIERRICYMNKEMIKVCDEVYQAHKGAIDFIAEHRFHVRDSVFRKLREGVNIRGDLMLYEGSRKNGCPTYMQFRRRLPCGSSQSVHYEIVREKDSFEVVLHVEVI